jgi:alkanesulfonate monooxygenase SsuD/methylene tetrahydromethanopterin reductase-like flavin-dependent oxidoreductase (luciferase family)
MRLVWTEEKTSWDGRFWRFPELTVYPRPVQQPSPPIYVAGAIGRSVDRAARLGDGWLCSPTETIDSVVRWSAQYRRSREALGLAPTWFLRRYVWIAPDRRTVEETVLPEYTAGIVAHAREGDDVGSREMLRRLDAGEEISPTELADDRLLWGAPADVVSQIQRYRDLTGADHLHVAFGMGLPGRSANSYLGSYEQTADMVRLFAREVMPAFR